jgi:hypothetical protein
MPDKGINASQIFPTKIFHESHGIIQRKILNQNISKSVEDELEI